MPQLLGMRRASGCVLRLYSKVRRIQIVAKIEAHRPDRRVIAHPAANRLRHIVEVARRGKASAGLLVRLREAPQTSPHVARRIENVTHVVKDDEAEAGTDERQAHGRRTQLQVVDEHGVAADRKTRKRIARSRLVHGKAAQGIAAAGEKVLRQWNYAGTAVRGFNTYARRAGKDVFAPETMKVEFCTTTRPKFASEPKTPVATPKSAVV